MFGLTSTGTWLCGVGVGIISLLRETERPERELGNSGRIDRNRTTAGVNDLRPRGLRQNPVVNVVAWIPATVLGCIGVC